jgi:hypothetical protein
MGFSPNMMNVMMDLWKNTDVKELRAKARRFLTELSDPALKSRVSEMLQMSYTKGIVQCLIFF